MDNNPNITPEDDFLNRLPKEDGFTAPEGYFDDLSERIRFRLADTADPKPDLPRDNPFTVPEGYFETLPGQLLARTVPPARGRIIHLQRWLYAAAAAIVLTAVSLVWLYNSPQETGTQLALDTISDDEIVTYLENHTLSDELLAEAFTDAHPETHAIESTPDSNQQIEQYLLETADEDLIIDEL